MVSHFRPIYIHRSCTTHIEQNLPPLLSVCLSATRVQQSVLRGSCGCALNLASQRTANTELLRSRINQFIDCIRVPESWFKGMSIIECSVTVTNRFSMQLDGNCPSARSSMIRFLNIYLHRYGDIHRYFQRFYCYHGCNGIKEIW